MLCVSMHAGLTGVLVGWASGSTSGLDKRIVSNSSSLASLLASECGRIYRQSVVVLVMALPLAGSLGVRTDITHYILN